MATRIGFIAFVLAACIAGCGGVVVEPGHRALVFDPQHGLSQEVLAPGFHRVGSARVDDFDVTYSTRTEPMTVFSQEALTFDARLSIIYRPIVAELGALDTEIGPAYYNEVVGPEFRSAARACFARHSYTDFIRQSEAIEDEIENDLRKRIAGKHIEISSVTLESLQLPPDIVAVVRERQLIEQQARKKKVESDTAWEAEKIELERNVERRRLQREAEGAH